MPDMQPSHLGAKAFSAQQDTGKPQHNIPTVSMQCIALERPSQAPMPPLANKSLMRHSPESLKRACTSLLCYFHTLKNDMFEASVPPQQATFHLDATPSSGQ